jgi:Rieske Fe-S protein
MKPVLRRRCVLQGACALGLGLAGSVVRGQTRPGDAVLTSPDSPASTTPDPATSAPPEENDRLVFAYGEREGSVVRPEDLTVGAEQTFAWAMQPGTGLVRNGTRLYQILLVRLDPASLAAASLARAVEGIVAYSGVCTHTGCDVTGWHADTRRFQCPCHESQFDPGDGARVIGGPALWPLAALPLTTIDGELAVAGPFEGRVGFQQPGSSPFGI